MTYVPDLDAEEYIKRIEDAAAYLVSRGFVFEMCCSRHVAIARPEGNFEEVLFDAR